VLAFCTSCGRFRAPLTGPSVNLAGKPSKLGGAVASTAGWIALLFGGSLALGVGLLLGAIFSPGVALALSLPIALLSAGVGFALLWGGRRLRRSGVDVERATLDSALLAMAAAGPGVGGRYGVTAAMAARALGIPADEADGLLTTLAKDDPDRLAVDVDDQGAVWYRATAAPAPFSPKARVDTSSDAPSSAEEDDAALDELARANRR
jgi:hypothetical protein